MEGGVACSESYRHSPRTLSRIYSQLAATFCNVPATCDEEAADSGEPANWFASRAGCDKYRRTGSPPWSWLLIFLVCGCLAGPLAQRSVHKGLQVRILLTMDIGGAKGLDDPNSPCLQQGSRHSCERDAVLRIAYRTT